MTRRPYLFDARSAGWQRITGWERYTRELATRLSATTDVEVRTGGEQRLRSRLWQDVVATPRAVRGHRLVHFPSFPPAPWIPRRTQVVYTLHDLTWWHHAETASPMGRHYYRRLASLAIRRGAHLVTVSQTVKDEVLDEFGVEEARVTVVPNGAGLPAPDAARLSALHSGRPYLLTVGTLEPRKNLRTLVNAYEQSGAREQYDLVVVGRAAWGEPPTGVRVMSGLSDAELAATYAAAAALLLPSLYEGFGLPAVEAMQQDTPVICSDLPVMREVTGGRATYVPATDVDSWSAALEAVSQLRPAAGDAAWAAASWNWDRCAATLQDLYRRLDGEMHSTAA